MFKNSSVKVGSELFEKTLAAHGVQRSDALYVLTSAGELLAGEKGVRYIVSSLGGLWVLVAILLDRLSNVASRWYRWIAKQRQSSCASENAWPPFVRYRFKG